MSFTNKPVIKTSNRNGYELRTDILLMAKDLVMAEYQAKFDGWNQTAERDSSSGRIVDSCNMPQFPQTNEILKTAELLYSFVNKQ